MKRILLLVLILIVAVILYFVLYQKTANKDLGSFPLQETTKNTNPLSITAMREKNYLGSDIVIEETLNPGSNYNQYITSYKSEGLKIYALLTVPTSSKPENGWPVILLNHGYIPPNQYSTLDSYSAATDTFARNGYIVFKPDYRGNGNSEGQPSQVYTSPDYITDDLNALSSIKKYKDSNPVNIGVWGHSMGGSIALHDLVITNDFKATVIWSGVVGTSPEIVDWWNKRIATRVLTTQNDQRTASRVEQVVKKYGTPEKNPDFWNSIDPNNYLSNIQTPIQVNAGTDDQTVPYQQSVGLVNRLEKAGKSVQFHSYEGADHNLSQYSGLAYERAVEFFNKYLK